MVCACMHFQRRHPRLPWEKSLTGRESYSQTEGGRRPSIVSEENETFLLRLLRKVVVVCLCTSLYGKSVSHLGNTISCLWRRCHVKAWGWLLCLSGGLWINGPSCLSLFHVVSSEGGIHREEKREMPGYMDGPLSMGRTSFYFCDCILCGCVEKALTYCYFIDSNEEAHTCSSMSTWGRNSMLQAGRKR